MAWTFYRPKSAKVSIRNTDDKQSTFDGISASDTISPETVANGINILANIVNQGNFIVNDKMQRNLAEEVIENA